MNYEERTKWLSGLKAGDEVIYRPSGSYGRGDGDTVSVVERVTKTQIIIKEVKEKIRRDTGYGPSAGRWSSRSEIRPVTKEDIERIKLIEDRYTIRLRIDKATDDQVKRIAAILREPKPEADGDA